MFIISHIIHNSVNWRLCIIACRVLINKGTRIHHAFCVESVSISKVINQDHCLFEYFNEVLIPNVESSDKINSRGLGQI